MKLNKKIKYGTIIAIVFFLIVFAYKVYAINKKYQQPRIVKYDINEQFTLDNCTYTVTDYRMDDVDSTRKMVYVGLTIKNTSTTVQTIELSKFSIESYGVNNDINMESFSECNDNKYLYFDIQPGEEETYTLPYNLPRIMMKKRIWNELHTRDLYLIFSLVPEKVMVILQ